ncbi:MAG: hypothetical protein A2939_02325 [Parcubacteria group bacterium RIFCSPLOWO2_01_FULL_48_18]|nr:MAG: hypothetical protein A3J67_02460 [Parcubacteria group bacterium RIFCSPHIGHO2_02_FULL_48_10b]OHB23225.1 MAG: hypothetical protein A2939_02325 [Parcubacteria group bacterium RIFCSPLOWO2_01_FULL_48_18]
MLYLLLYLKRKEDVILRTPVENAIEWVSQELKRNPSANKLKLVDEASMKFNLNPLQGEALIRFMLGK